MKKKDVAGILALVFGGFGIHQFYLDKPGRGIAHIIFCWNPVSWIIAWVTAIVIFSMGEEEFDLKYNSKYIDIFKKTDFDRASKKRDHRKDYDHNRKKRNRDDFERELEKRWKYPEEKRKKSRSSDQFRKKPNPYKQEGIKRFKEYDYDEAIKEFEKALEIDASDVATHFNLACAYSLNENADKAFYHLDKAISFGFKDLPRIKEHDALAYLRIQDEFDTFAQNGYRLSSQKKKRPEPEMPKEDLLSTQPNLLDQLNKLGELKEKGLLTEEEFSHQKRKLLG